MTATLTRRQQLAWHARQRLGKSDREIARMFGVTRSAITHRRRSALERMSQSDDPAIRQLARSLMGDRRVGSRTPGSLTLRARALQLSMVDNV